MGKEKNILENIHFDIHTYLVSLIKLGVFKVTTVFTPSPNRDINLTINNLSAKKRKMIESLLIHKFREYIVDINFTSNQWGNNEVLNIYLKSAKDLFYIVRKEKIEKLKQKLKEQ